MKVVSIISVIIVVLFFSQCVNENDGKWKTIQVGNYFFDFPPDFELIEEQGIDSYVGRIKGDSMSLGFDFGYYSNTLEQTTEEYLENGYWRHNLIYQFMEPEVVYDKTNTPEVAVLSIRKATLQDSAFGKCDYIATCKHKDIEFQSAIYIPEEIKQSNIRIDTIDGQYRKIVYSADPKKGATGIYIRSLNSFNKDMNNYLALSISTSNLTKEQQDIALKIFKSGRVIRQQKKFSFWEL